MNTTLNNLRDRVSFRNAFDIMGSFKVVSAVIALALLAMFLDKSFLGVHYGTKMIGYTLIGTVAFMALVALYDLVAGSWSISSLVTVVACSIALQVLVKKSFLGIFVYGERALSIALACLALAAIAEGARMVSKYKANKLLEAPEDNG